MSAVVTSVRDISPGRAIALPLAFVGALLSVLFVPWIGSSPHIVVSFLLAASGLIAWAAWLWAKTRRGDRTLTFRIGIFKNHWVQALTQVPIYAYWGWYFSLVYPWLPLVFAQLFFAYAVESLLYWSRHGHYRLGFGPWPIIGSINIFLWFQPEWFYLQFALVLVGYLAKDLLSWEREGRRRHIFNPSSFPLSVAAFGLVLFGATGEITLAREIAQTQVHPPNIYLVLFLVSIPVQIIFGVARMTIPAVLTLFTISFVYQQVTGVFLFPDAYVTVPVFIGTLLLITDPATSPRTELGQMVFGVLYGLGVVAAFVTLTAIGAPDFYDKLLPVPFLNLMVPWIDKVVRSEPFAGFDLARIAPSLTPRRRAMAYTGLWASAFVSLSALGGFGDRHPGQYLPFWQRACEEGSARACRYMVDMEAGFCERGSAWACNELGFHLAHAGVGAATVEAFRRACEGGLQAGCENAERGADGRRALRRPEPRLEDLPILVRGSKAPVRERDPEALYAMACERGWEALCERVGRQGSAP